MEEKAQPVVLVDVDSVLADLSLEWFRRYNQDYNDHLTDEHIKDWNTWKYVKPECGKKIYDYLKDETLYDAIKPIPGAIKGVEQLRESGYRCVYLTAGLNSGKFRWLQRYGFLPEDDAVAERDYIQAYDKSLIHGDLLIDDRDKNVAEFRFGPAILFNQPWNRSFEWMYRATSWNGVVSLARYHLSGVPLENFTLVVR